MKEFIKANIGEIIPIITMLISVIGSWFIASYKAKSEIKSEIRKVKINFNREDVLERRSAYAEMITKLEAYVFSGDEYARSDAIRATTKFSTFAPTECYLTLSRVANAIHDRNPQQVKNLIPLMNSDILPKIQRADHETKNQ